MSQTLHLVIGPVGAGKSTYVSTLTEQHRAVPLILDAWMATLFGADERPEEGRIEWYLERVQRCLDQMWTVAEDALAAGVPVVLEAGLIQRQARHQFYERIDAVASRPVVHVVDAHRDVRRERVMRRNEEKGATFSVEVPLPFFELASDLWQEPDAEEQQWFEFVHVDTNPKG